MNQQETGAFTALTTPKYYVFITKEKEEIPERVKEKPQLYVGQLDSPTPLEPIHYVGVGICFFILICILFIAFKSKYENDEFKRLSKKNNNL